MSDQASARPLTELQVSAHLVALEAGTYCAFVAPGSPAMDPATGLPAVRLSVAPGVPSKVEIVGFGDAGWLSGRDDAALVRVEGGPGQVLVTVYRGPDPAIPAPKVQMLRVSDAPAGALPMPPPPLQTAPIEAMAHVYGLGDIGGPFGDWIGERGSQRWIEGFALQAQLLAGPGEMEYQAVLGRGWLSPWVEAGQFCGSRGMSLPILGLNVRLVGAAASAFDLAVSASFVDGTLVGPVSDQPAEAPSLAALEAFQVVLLPKRAEPPVGKRRR